jgi:hypothetical protein
MATSPGKTAVLILLIIIILWAGLRLTPFFIAPLGIFSGAVHILQTPFENSLTIRHFPFRLTPFFLVSLILMIIWIFVIIWVYRDAESRGLNGVLWALLVLIGSVIGLLIYLIIRNENVPQSPPSQTTPCCPQCSQPIGPNFTYCSHCGTRLQQKCPKCQQPTEPSWKVCPHCGEKLHS